MISKRDKRFIFLSTLIHTAILSSFYFMPRHRKDVVTVEFKDKPKPAGQKGTGANNVGRIIPRSDIIKSHRKMSKKGFWGIGINISLFDSLILTDRGPMYGWRVVLVPDGYPAESLGLKVGDIIATVNGKPVGPNNDIKGDGPTPVTFEIFRNGRLITLTVNRAWINEE